MLPTRNQNRRILLSCCHAREPLRCSTLTDVLVSCIWKWFASLVDLRPWPGRREGALGVWRSRRVIGPTAMLSSCRYSFQFLPLSLNIRT